MKRFLVVLPMILLLLAPQGDAGDKPPSPWKPFLPADAYKELTERSIKFIEDTAKSTDKNAAAKIHVEAAILEGYTRSEQKPSDPFSRVGNAARYAARAAQEKNLKRLSDFGKLARVDRKTTPLPVEKPVSPPSLDDLMEIFRNKSKGGEGIHADLQYQPKFKNLNGSEALIGGLASKKLSEENLAKVAKELRNLAYRTAVVGALTYEYTPAKDASKWREYSMVMRDSAIALAEAAQQKNGEGVHKAAEKLQNSCTECHRDFRKK